MPHNPLRFSKSREKREKVVEKIKSRIRKFTDQTPGFDVKWIGTASEIITHGVRIWIAVEPDSQVINIKVDESTSHRHPDDWPQNPKKNKQPDTAVGDTITLFREKLSDTSSD